MSIIPDIIPATLLITISSEFNFGNLEEFQNFVNNQFFNNNELVSGKYSESGDLCIYEISIKNKENEADNNKNVTIIMQLQEGTDFKMSFSVEE